MNGSRHEQFDDLYERLSRSLAPSEAPGLAGEEIRLLHQVPSDGAISLKELAHRLGSPKSSTSVMVKRLACRGYLLRTRDGRDERRLRIELTAPAREYLAGETALDPRLLAAALVRIPPGDQAELLERLTDLVEAAEAVAVERRTDQLITAIDRR